LREIDDVVAEVFTSENPLVRLGTRGTNPSVRRSDPVGRIITASERQRISVEELTNVAVSSALDVHVRQLPFRSLFRIKRDGLLGDTSRPWQSVFSRPDDFPLTAKQRAYVDDFLRVVDETEQMRVDAGLRPRARRGEEGWFYVPRQVRTIRGVELQRPSSASLQPVYDDALQGYQRGVRYDRNPRATLEVHVKAAYREVENAQLSRALEGFSVRPVQLVPAHITEAAVVAARERSASIVRLQRLRREQLRLQASGKLPAGTSRAVRRELEQAREANRVAIDEAISDLAASRRAFDAKKRAYARALESARKAEVAPGALFGRDQETIGIGFWRNRAFPREYAERLHESLGLYGVLPQRPWLPTRAFTVLGNYIRFLASVGDFAAPLTHGLPLLADNPAAWGKATARHYAAWFDPGVQARFMRDHRATFQKMGQHGVTVGDPEFFAALAPGQGLSLGKLLELFPKGDVARDIAQGIGRQTFGRFQASYGTFLGDARALWWESLENSRLFAGRPSDLAHYIRNATGALDSRALGVGPGQRAVEGVWLAFSPRLLRSTVSLTWDMFEGAVRLSTGRAPTRAQIAAMANLTKLTTAAMGIYVAVGLAMERPWSEIAEGLNPLNGKRFLSYNINGDWVGVGGQVRAIGQALVRTVSAAIPGGDPAGNLMVVDQFENPLIAAWMSRGAPGVNIAGGVIEAATGGSVNALPFDEVVGVPDLLKHLGTSATPFAAQGYFEGEQAKTTLLAGAGARTSPPTAGEQRNLERWLALTREGAQPQNAFYTLAFREEFRNLGADVRARIDATPAVAAASAQVAIEQRAGQSGYQA